MKKIILLTSIIFFNFILTAQVIQLLPEGFRRAELPEYWKNYGVKVPFKLNSTINNSSSPPDRTGIENGIQISMNNETMIGSSFFDFQNSGSIGNRLLLNSDGTMSATWTFSPDAISTSTPPYPNRRNGYNYFNGNIWLYPAPIFDTIRTGFPNIVVTSAGREMIISQELRLNQFGTPSDSNFITISWRAVKGTAAWDTIIRPWGTNVSHSLPKACGGYTNENVYMIFQGGSGGTLSQTPPSSREGYYGPIYFARSLDGGITWSSPIIIPQIDSTNYQGFTGDGYSIFATGDTVAISYGNVFTDVGLLKSTDAGLTWTKKIIQLHPQPMYNINADSLSDVNHDGIADTILTNGGDSKVLIDNNGMCHVWFSAFRYINDITGDSAYTAFYGTDNLYYWNESMPQNNGYVAIASAQDFNGNGMLDFPVDSFSNCIREVPWGQYGGGLTQMPSAGIDPLGNIFLTYQTVAEEPQADTMDWHKVHRHVYMKKLSPPYNPYDWTYPYDIVPSIAAGGYGDYQEAIYASVAPRLAINNICVLYQRDDVPGNSLAPVGTCDYAKNFGNSSDIIIDCLDSSVVGILNSKDTKIFVGQNYPNPASGITYINIGLNRSAEIKIDFYDLSGRPVFNESKGYMSSGTHTISADVSKLSQGVYIYSVSANGEKSINKMLVKISDR